MVPLTLKKLKLECRNVIICLVLYFLYTYDLPELDNNAIFTFADDTTILILSRNNTETANKLCSNFQNWMKNGKSN